MRLSKPRSGTGLVQANRPPKGAGLVWRLANGPLGRLLGGEAQPYGAAAGAALGAWLLAPIPWPVALAAAAVWV